MKPGGQARFDIIRDGKPMSVTATVVPRPSEEQLAATLGGNDDSGGFGRDNDDDNAPATPANAAGALGMSVQPLTPGIARALQADPTTQGVVIAAVAPTSDAAGKLQRGDIISAVNGAPVRTTAEFDAAVARAKAAGRPQVLLLVQRGRGPAGFLAVKLKG